MARRHKNEKIIFYPLANGLDSGVDPMISQDSVVHVENMETKRQGVLSKREGTTTIGSTSNETITTYKDNPVTFGVSGPEYYSGSTYANGDIVSIDTVPNAFYNISVKNFGGLQENKIKHPSHVRHETFDVIAYTNWDNENTVGSLQLKVFNSTTGNLVSSAELVDSTVIEQQNAICVIDGSDRCYVFYTNATNLKYRAVDSDGVIGSETAVPGTPPTADLANKLIDACTFGTSEADIFICYVAATDTLATVKFTGGASPSASNDSKTISGIANAACCRTQETAVLIYSDGALVACRGYDNTLDTTITDATVDASVTGLTSLSGVAVSNTQIDVFYVYASDMYVSKYTISGGTGTGHSPTAIYGVTPVSKPIFDNSQTFLWLTFEDVYNGVSEDTNRTAVLVTTFTTGSIYTDFSEGLKPVAKAHISILENPTSETSEYKNALPSITAVDLSGSDTTYFCPLIRIGSWKTSVLTLTLATESKPNIIEGNGNLLIASGMPYEFDNRNVFEQGFLTVPQEVSINVTTGSGTNLSAGLYGYRYTYEYRDAQGNLHISAPSPVESVTVASTTTTDVRLTARALSLTWKDDIKVAFYRTQVTGKTYYRIGVKDSDKTQTNIIFTDDLADTTISSYAQLYTNGNVLENIQPPPTKVQTVYQNRHFCVDAERPDTRVRYSNVFLKYVGVRHSDKLFIDVTPNGGDITALDTFDDKLVIFKEDAIYATYGKGKSDENGVRTANDYAEPILISNAKGCVNAETVVRVPDGLLFQGNGGIYLLDRGWKVHLLFGNKVQHQYEANLIDCLKKAVHFPLKSQVIFFADDTTTMALVYDYKFEKWTTHTNFDGVSATAARDTIYFIDGDSSLRVIDISDDLTSTNYKDDAAFVTAKIDTGWLSFAGQLGFQRVREVHLLGYNLLDHDLNVRVGYDFDPKLYAARTYESEDLENFGKTKYFERSTSATYDQQAYIVRCILPKQKCTSIRICIDDAADAAGITTPTFEIVGIAFVVSGKTGAHRIESNRRVP